MTIIISNRERTPWSAAVPAAATGWAIARSCGSRTSTWTAASWTSSWRTHPFHAGRPARSAVPILGPSGQTGAARAKTRSRRIERRRPKPASNPQRRKGPKKKKGTAKAKKVSEKEKAARAEQSTAVRYRDPRATSLGPPARPANPDRAASGSSRRAGRSRFEINGLRRRSSLVVRATCAAHGTANIAADRLRARQLKQQHPLPVQLTLHQEKPTGTAFARTQ